MHAWKPLVAAAVVLSVLVALVPAPAAACTAFGVETPSGKLLAKGFDWITGEGWLVDNERGRTRTLLFPAGRSDDAWTARYASLTLTTVGPGFPVSGMNEAGLALEALVDLSVTPATTPAPGRLIGLEFIQYGLDRFATVEELAAFAKSAALSQLAVGLHFFACDRAGACAVIETRGGSTRVTRSAFVLANRPYDQDLNGSQPSRIAALLGLRPERGSSAQRFGLVAHSLRTAKPSSCAAALELLEQVAMRGRTQWQLVWDLEGGALLLRQREAGLGTSTVQLEDSERECHGAPRVRDLGRAPLGSAREWTGGDVRQAEALVVRQLGRSPGARALAERVAQATRASGCR